MSSDPELKVPSFIPVKVMFLRQRPWSLDRRIYRQRDYTGRSPGIKYVSCWKATEEAQGCTQRIYCYCALMWETFLFHCRGEQWVIVSSTFFIITGFYFINESDDVKGTHYIFNSCFFLFFFNGAGWLSASPKIPTHSQNNMDIAG